MTGLGKVAGEMRTVYRPAIAIAAAAVPCAFALKFLPLPFCWIGLLLSGAAWLAAYHLAGLVRGVLIVLGAVLCAAGLGEVVLSRTPLYEDVVRTVAPPLNRRDPLLGWALIPAHVSHATAIIGGVRLYDVKYTIDAAGRRIAPPDRGNGIEGCLLLFADSFTFGEGVNDRDTYPFQVGLMTRGRFRVVNLGVPGYGAEQMLAMVERGDLAAKLPCEPTHIFYVALPHHVLRAAGKTSFSINGPRYRLDAAGRPEYVGTNPRASDKAVASTPWMRELSYQMSKSRLYRFLSTRPAATTAADIELYFAIVREAFVDFRRIWPKAERHIISWDIDGGFSNGLARFHAGLATVDAKVHFIDGMLPGYTHDNSPYRISRVDQHPNAKAYALVAAYLVKHVLAARLTPRGAAEPAPRQRERR